MDMVAEAKKREGWKAVDDFWIGDSQLPNGEDGVAMSLDGHTEFIANAPTFIVVQDKRIKELEKRYALYRESCNESIDEYKSVVGAFLKALDEQGSLWNETVQQQLYALKDLVA